MRTPSWLSTLLACSLMLCALILAAPAVGQMDEEMKGGQEMSAEQKAMMEAWEASMKLGPEHEHLAEMTGEYDMKVTMWQDPEGEPEVITGTASRSMIMDGRILREKVTSEIMGQPFHGEARVGYDNVTGEYWSTWVDNMSTGYSWSRGDFEDDGTILMLGKAPNPVAGGMVDQKTVISEADDGTETHVMYEKRDGDWVKMMEIAYTPK